MDKTPDAPLNANVAVEPAEVEVWMVTASPPVPFTVPGAQGPSYTSLELVSSMRSRVVRPLMAIFSIIPTRARERRSKT